MIIELKKFGQILISRPAGKEAFLVIRSYVADKSDEPIELSFESVNVVGPSWLDEVLTSLKAHYPQRKIICLETQNESVIKSLETINFFAK